MELAKKRITLFLTSTVSGGTKAGEVRYDISNLSARLKVNKRYRLTLQYFGFFADSGITANKVISVQIPEFIQDGATLRASTTSTNAGIQPAVNLAFLNTNQGNDNRCLHFQSNGAEGVEGYFTQNLITVRLVDMSTGSVFAFTNDVNYGVHLSVDELE
jgi:hypothetical protein